MKLFYFLLAMLFCLGLEAEVTLPRIFSDNMVLQQGIEIPVWGQASPKERVSVTIGKKKVRTRADEMGNWSVKLPVMEYGGPYSVTVKGKNTVTFSNVMIGEVWVCSGQSNMEWPVAKSNNAEAEIESANNKMIRIFTVPKRVSQFPQDDIEGGEWLEVSPETIPEFSAVGYFFGRNLQEHMNVPIGLIESAWGGTVAETWISSETISHDPDFKESLKQMQTIDFNISSKEVEDKIREKLGELPDKDEGIVEGKAIWASVEYDDSEWKGIAVPGYWEHKGYDNIDGVLWVRKVFTVDPGNVGKSAVLKLGKVNDSDITWINGTKVGETKRSAAKERIYEIPANLLKDGDNLITVRIEDIGGDGGIWGNPDDIYISVGEENIPLGGMWKCKFGQVKIVAAGITPNKYPSLLFNGMINPIVPYGIKGAIWYQGESNASRAQQYKRIFPSLIKDWRSHWGEGDFPFLFVQLANFMKPKDEPGESTWAELREAQASALKLESTGMAVIIDAGEADDIHPRDKQIVGKRLALSARKVAYGEDIIYSGPVYKSMKLDENQILITFDNVGSGLMVKDKYGYLKGFTIAGEDHVFHWAKAVVINKNIVVVFSTEVKTPVAVRYGWADNPDDANLYNKEGLPASPFRTDDWEGITE